MPHGGTLGPQDLMPQPLLPELSHALAGAVFPLSRAELIQIARENEAPTTLLTLLEGIPARAYRQLSEVERAIERSPVAGSVDAPLDR